MDNERVSGPCADIVRSKRGGGGGGRGGQFYVGNLKGVC